MRTSEVVRLSEGGAGPPGVVNTDRVVVTQDISVRLQKLRGLVVEACCLECELTRSSVEDLINGLAGVDQRWVGTNRFHGGIHTAAGQLDKGIDHSVLFIVLVMVHFKVTGDEDESKNIGGGILTLLAKTNGMSSERVYLEFVSPKTRTAFPTDQTSM